MVNVVDLTVYYADPSKWKYYKSPYFHYSGHDHYRSLFEMDNDCGTCSGAKCDRCEKIYDSHIQANGISCDTLYDLAIEAGCPENIAEDMVYYDFYNPAKNDGWRFLWPTWEEMKDKYPDKWQEWEKEIMEAEQ